MQMNIPTVDTSLEYIPEEEYVGGMYIQTRIVEELSIDPTAINTMDSSTTCS